MSDNAPQRGPLRHLRVLDLADAVGEAAARLLSDLGAETIKVEPAQGAPTRSEAPLHDGHSLPYLVRNAGKQIGTGLADDELDRLLAGADIAFCSPASGLGLEADALRARHPRLVVVDSSPFGRSGPRAGWQATPNTLLALSGSLSRSGRPGDAPLLPPAGIAQASAATQMAYAALIAHVQRLRSDAGQLVDIAHLEAVATGLDPAYGVQGSAAAGRSGKIRRDRPPADSYPIYPCADGAVRLCLLSPRQWAGMFEWLGRPAEFADPKFASIAARVAASDRLDALIVAHFRERTGAELVEQAASLGVPLAQVLSLGEALDSPHFLATGAIGEVELAPGLSSRLPVGFADIDGARLGIDGGPRALRTALWPPRDDSRAPRGAGASGELPLSGVRVLDLGVIVFGAEIGRALADFGADVIKVESQAFPDGLRQTRNGESMNASFAWGQRNKRSLGLDLRSEEGKAVFRELARHSDVVLSNFKPGTLTSLGIDHATLSAINPRIIVVESAAFSSRGPWARRLGYGPLVRAACGISSLWKYRAGETECWDGVTVYPDHVAAKAGALCVLAALLDREQSGHGVRIELAQSEVVLHQLAAFAAQESLAPGSVRPQGNRDRELFGDLFPADGDDEWCLIEARTPDELAALAGVIGWAGTAIGPSDELHAAVAAWARSLPPQEAMEKLQAAGVPAAAMQRLDQIAHDPQLIHRASYRPMTHPALEHTLPAENSSAAFSALPDLPMRPAPVAGEHTAEVLGDVLGWDEQRIAALLAAGVAHARQPNR
ncbi:CoA transferase [Nocardioides dubius]|uniref:CoA transferase n=1 Tax=Nocardioides dubius TaxID=317019 RepID=A0ABN1U1L7_9ACTN